MRIRLQDRYSLAIAFITLMVLSILAGSLFFEFKTFTRRMVSESSRKITEKLIEQLKSRGQLTGRMLSENLANDLYYLDLPAIDDLIRTTGSQKDILYVTVYDKNGGIVRSTSAPTGAEDEGLPDTETIKGIDSGGKAIVVETANQLCIFMPVWVAEERVGCVEVGLSKRFIDDEVKEMTASLSYIEATSLNKSLNALSFMTVLIFLSGILISYFLIRRLLKPLGDLIHYSQKIGDQEYDFTIAKQYRGEIGDLVNAFDTMKENIRKTTVSLVDMENLVEVRTKELVRLNEDLKTEVEERKSAESQLKDYRDHLESLVEKRTAELKESNLQLKREIKERMLIEADRREVELKLKRAEKMEAVGRLASGVAHDLNNILTGIVSYPDLILMDLAPDDPVREKLITIRKSGQKAAAIVQDLLTLGRRGVGTKEVVDVGQIIMEYLESPEHQKILDAHPHIRIQKTFNEKPHTIQGSSIHLTKTVMNLVLNAAESIEDEGSITISLENRYIEKPIKGYENFRKGNYIVLSVSDTGKGIPPEDIDLIFEPFFTKKSMGRSGSGLGMTVVWGTVKDLQGYIDVSSQEDVGTTFTLYFPATGEKVVPVVSTDWIQKYRGNGETILIVDDSEEQREILSGILRRLLYDVKVASSGEIAVSYLRQQGVDLVVLDMIMDPGMDGLETYEEIIKLYPRQKAIIASGYSESGRVRQAQKLGVGAYVQKPYKIKEVAKAIKLEMASIDR